MAGVERLTAAEAGKRRALRRMKAVAAGLLVLAAIVYVLSGIFAGPLWLGYVHAAAEASMVGALADWFAVTALFRRPLGLPIPHTALIPNRKNLLGASLGDFVGSNFMSEQVVRDRLHRAEISKRVGVWLSDRENARRITSEFANVARGLVTVLRDEDVQAVVEHAVVQRLMAIPWGPPLGKLLGQVLEDGSHHKLVDLMADRAYEWVRDNHEAVKRVVSDRSPSWSPKFVDSLLGERVYNEILGFAWAMKTDVNHPMRAAVDRFLIDFAGDLRTDPLTMERAEQVKRQVLTHPEVQHVIGTTWANAKRMLLDAAEDPSSELRRRVLDGLISLGVRLETDDATRAKVEGWIEGGAAYVVTHYRDEILTLITDTIERWDAEETSRKIELQVGRDLQFIRINGTVVGALAGLVTYAASQLLF